MANPNTSAALEVLLRERAKLEAAVLAKLTRRGYDYDAQKFLRWAAEHGFSLPATTEAVALYVTDELTRGMKISTTMRRAFAIRYWHRARDMPDPVTKDIWLLLRGARRLRFEGPRRVEPLSIDEVRRISALLAGDDTAVAARNRSIVLLGFASALRSASISRLRLEDVHFVPQGVILDLWKEKNNQEGPYREVAIPFGEHPDTCPVAALRAWLKHRGETPGPLYRRFDHRAQGGAAIRAQRVCQIVQRCVRRLGLDATKYGSHSLRRGFCSTAADNGCTELQISATTGHRDISIVREYCKRRDLWVANASARLGL